MGIIGGCALRYGPLDVMFWPTRVMEVNVPGSGVQAVDPFEQSLACRSLTWHSSNASNMIQTSPDCRIISLKVFRYNVTKLGCFLPLPQRIETYNKSITRGTQLALCCSNKPNAGLGTPKAMYIELTIPKGPKDRDSERSESCKHIPQRSSPTRWCAQLQPRQDFLGQRLMTTAKDFSRLQWPRGEPHPL